MVNIKSTSYFSNISQGKPHLLKQFLYDQQEQYTKEYENSDPLDEETYKVTGRLIHRYKNRVLLLVTDRCKLYCRHCFRRDFIESSKKDISIDEIEEACSYIKSHKEVQEILLSGGDPLVLQPDLLSCVLNRIKEARPDIVIRIGSRLPIVDPKSITDKIVSILKCVKPIWLSIQCNHPDELTPQVKHAVDMLVNAGVSIVNQSVLLKGVNDSVEVLKTLSNKLLAFNIKPYYLFQGDLAKGTSHFRVPIIKGLEIVKELRSQVSGLSMPTYAVDIPGGGGKIPLVKDYIIDEDENWLYLTNNDGFKGKYPKE